MIQSALHSANTQKTNIQIQQQDLKSQLAGGNQLAIYKRGREFELGMTDNKSSKLPERDLNPGPLDCESDVPTTRPPCLLEDYKNTLVAVGN